MAQMNGAPAQVTISDLERLVKMLRLLGSDAVGERAAAAAKVHSFVTANAIDWTDLVFPPDHGPAPVTVTVGNQTQAQAQVQAAERQAEALRQELSTMRIHAAGLSAELERQRKVIRVYEQEAGMLRMHPATGEPWRLVNPVRHQPASTDGSHSKPAPSASASLPLWVNPVRPPWVDAVRAMLVNHADKLRGDREADFLRSRLDSGRPVLTDRQAKWMGDILARAGLRI